MSENKYLSIRQEEKQRIRKFSKSTPEGVQARTETALTILTLREKRAELSSLINNLVLDIQRYEVRMTEHFERAKECQEKLDELFDQFAQAESALLNRLYKFFNTESKTVKFFRLMIGRSISSQQYWNSESERFSSQIDKTARVIRVLEQEKEELESSQEVLQSFYVQQALIFNAYTEELIRRREIEELIDLRRIAKEHSVVFVHGITVDVDESMMTRNDLIRGGTSWTSRLAIVLSLQPDLSCSTICAGDNTANMWSKMGIILSGGKIINAHHTDAATRVTGLRDQESNYFQRSYLEMETDAVIESIERSIRQRSADGYNELVVRDVTIAGFYVCLDPDTKRNTFDPAPHQEIVEHLSSLGLPIFIVHNGRVYHGSLNVNRTTNGASLIRVGDPLEPSDLTKVNVSLGESVMDRTSQQAKNALRIQV